MFDDEDDPGWPTWWIMFVPGLGPRMAKKRAEKAGGPNPLVMLRQLFLVFNGSLVLYAFVLVMEAKGTSHGGSALAWAIGVVAVGGVALVGARALEPRLDASDEAHLTSVYRTRLFIRIFAAEVPALIGFLAAMITDVIWVYFLGWAIALLGMARAAPSKRNIAKDQRVIAERVPRVSLTRALCADPKGAGGPTTA